MNDDTAKAAGPDAPGRRKALLHPRLDANGKALGAVQTVLGRWDGLMICLLACRPDFDPHDFAWVGTEDLGGGVLGVAIYAGLTAESPYVWITEDDGPGRRYLVCLHVGDADGEPPEDPFLVSGGTAEQVAAEALRMIASARSMR
ncbi:MAG: hypothetical protein QM729_06925 [Solirubrobacterales bacterium]